MSPTQPSPFYSNIVFYPNQTISPHPCPHEKSLLIPPQCQALMPASALECLSSSSSLSSSSGTCYSKSCLCSSSPGDFCLLMASGWHDQALCYTLSNVCSQCTRMCIYVQMHGGV